MSDYTVINLHDVEGCCPKFGMEEMEARFASGDLGLTKSGVSLQSLAPDKTQPFGHHHHAQEELYVVVGGAGRVKLDDDVVELQALGRRARASRASRARSRPAPDGLEFIAFGAPAVENLQQEAPMEQGWWDG